VITTSSALRMQEKIHLIITEVNIDHLELAEDYRNENASKGAPFPQCNCTAVPPALIIKPLLDSVGIKEVLIDSYQSISGSGAKAVGRWKEERLRETSLPKAFSYDKAIENPEITYEGNVRPIGQRNSKGEEDKVERETLKMLGEYEDGRIKPANFLIDCMCNRVPTLRGHFEHIRIKPIKSCTKEDIISIYEEFNNNCRELYGDLPSSPNKTLLILNREPQTRYDVNLGKGMSTVIGEIEVEHGWIKIRALSDNLRKGAAKGSIQLMEYLFKVGFL
jgi:aspartate-semialdehyde dehydrogenase